MERGWQGARSVQILRCYFAYLQRECTNSWTWDSVYRRRERCINQPRSCMTVGTFNKTTCRFCSHADVYRLQVSFIPERKEISMLRIYEESFRTCKVLLGSIRWKASALGKLFSIHCFLRIFSSSVASSGFASVLLFSGWSFQPEAEDNSHCNIKANDWANASKEQYKLFQFITFHLIVLWIRYKGMYLRISLK